MKKITTPIRWALYLILLLPKMAISMTLLTIRTVWLAATDSFADLILNAIALEFVSAIDELLFEKSSRSRLIFAASPPRTSGSCSRSSASGGQPC